MTGSQFSSFTVEMRIEVKITTHLGDIHTFVEGDVVRYLVSLNRDAYILMIYEDANRALYQVYPDSSMEDGFLHAGIYLQIPGNAEKEKFVVTAPFGNETMWVFASNKPFPGLYSPRYQKGFFLLNHSLDDIRNNLKNYAENMDAGFGETKMDIETFSNTTTEGLTNL